MRWREEFERLIRRTGKIVLEVAGVTVAIVAVLLAVLAWRLSSGPVSMSILNQSLEDAANQSMSEGHIDIGDTELHWSQEDRRLALRLRDLRVSGADDNVILQAPELAVELSVPGLLRGQVQPTRMDFYGVSITLLRRAGSGISLGLAAADAPPAAPHENSPLMKDMLHGLGAQENEQSIFARLTHLGIRDAKLRFVDEVNNVTFEAPKANLLLARGAGGIAGILKADLQIGERTGSLELSGALPTGAQNLQITARAAGIAPAALGQLSPKFADYALFDAPIEANGTLDMGIDGHVNSAQLILNAGTGTLALPLMLDKKLPLDKAYARLLLDGAAKRIALQELVFKAGPHTFALSGTVDYELADGIDLAKARIDLASSKMQTEVPGFFENTVVLNDVKLRALVDFDAGVVDLDEFSLKSGGGTLNFSGVVTDGPRSPAIRARAALSRIPFDTLQALWPVILAKGAREWTVKNMSGGMVDSGSFQINVPAGRLADADDHIPIPDEELRFEFTLSGTTIHYLQPMPPLTNAMGRGLVLGNKFDAWITSANIAIPQGGSLSLTNGHFYDHELAKKGAEGVIALTLKGATADLLALLDHEPLGYISKFGVDPKAVGGTGEITPNISLPLVKDVTFDQVKFDGKAHADNVTLPQVQKDLSVTGGALDFDVTRAGLKAKGKISANGSSLLDFEWQESFVQGGPGTSYRISGPVNDADRNALGIKVDQYVDGFANIDAQLKGKGKAISDAKIKADFTPSVLKVGYLGWKKAAGRPASGDIEMSFAEKGGYTVNKLNVSGDGIDLQGKLALGPEGELLSADFPVVKLDRENDLVLKAERDTRKALVINVEAKRYDLRGLLNSFLTGSPFQDEKKKEIDPNAPKPELMSIRAKDQSRYMYVTAHMAEAFAHNGVELRNLKASASLVDDDLYLTELTASDPANTPFSIVIRNDGPTTRSLNITADNSGLVFEGLDLLKGVKGGTFSATGTFDDAQPASPLKGKVKAKKLRVSKVPALAKILTIGSLTGILDTLQGEGIFFDGLDMPFHMTEHRIHIDEARMSGPAIGLTLSGQVDRATDQLDLNGTVVPAYTLNSILGNVPLLGPLIVGRKGEGIFAATYGVKGDINKPEVTVNPLAALAPGFLRRIFEFGNTLPPENAAARDAEKKAAPALLPKEDPESGRREEDKEQPEKPDESPAAKSPATP